MRKWFKKVALFQLLVLLLSCTDKADDPYFARPDSLASPIYQRLEEKGDFSLFLKCIDKSGYADVLKRAGYYTLFAPTDEAVTAYLTKNSLGSVDEIDSATCKKIVGYSLIFTAYQYENIDDAHATGGDYLYNRAFRRKSTLYKGVYEGTSLNLGEIKVVDINWVADEDVVASGGILILASDDNSYKYIPVFTKDFMSRAGLTDFDYNYFFPEVNLSDFNVADASVVDSNIMAENGYIHSIDKVVEPLINLEEMLEGKEEYSMFKNILDKYLVNYNLAPDDYVSNYNNYTGNTDPIYVKGYPYLKFAPNTETMDPLTSVPQDQYNSMTMFVPNNEAVQKFFDEKFLTYYGSLDYMSQALISDFINSHLYTSTVWPSRFELAETKFTDEDIIEANMASNGLFYGTKRVQESDDFFTVYGEINLNPSYSLFLQALKDNDLQYVIKNSNIDYTVFMVPDSVMTAIGFEYDAARSSWSFEPDPMFESAAASPSASLLRFLKLHIVYNTDITDFSELGMIKTYGDEYIKYEDGQLTSSGNGDIGTSATPTDQDLVPNNGTTYKFTDNPLMFSTKSPMEHLEDLGYKYFTDFIKGNADLYDTDTRTLRDLNGGVPNTIFALSNTTIRNAIKAGDLPRSTSPGSTEEQTMVKNFFRYHMVVGTSIANGIRDVNKSTVGTFPTAYKDIDGKTYLDVVRADTLGNLSVLDRSGALVPLDVTKSNILSNRVTIHELTTYLNPYEEDSNE